MLLVVTVIYHLLSANYLQWCGWQKMTVGFGFTKNCGFRFSIGFTKLTTVWFFGSVFALLFNGCAIYWVLISLLFYGAMLEMTRFCAELVQLIFSRSSSDLIVCCFQTNKDGWMDGSWSVDVWLEEKYFDCWSYHADRWTVNETVWKTVP